MTWILHIGHLKRQFYALFLSQATIHSKATTVIIQKPPLQAEHLLPELNEMFTVDFSGSQTSSTRPEIQ